MKRPTAIVLALAVLGCSGILQLATAQSRRLADFEDCATTTLKMSNNRIFLGADVIKYVKLRNGQGHLDCMALCRASDECWSYNYDKTRKFCYLSSDDGEELKTRRRQTWASGYRACVAHSDNTEWNNFAVDFSTLAPTWETIDVQYDWGDDPDALTAVRDGVIIFKWEAAEGTKDLNGAALPQYRIRCGPNNTDWHCDETSTEVWNSGYGLIEQTQFSTVTSDDFSALFDIGVIKCFVELYINGVKTACSKPITDIIDPLAAPVVWQPPNVPDPITGLVPGRRKLLYSEDFLRQPIIAKVLNPYSDARNYGYFFLCTYNTSTQTFAELWSRIDACGCGFWLSAEGYPYTTPDDGVDYSLLRSASPTFIAEVGLHSCFLMIARDGGWTIPGSTKPTIVQVTRNTGDLPGWLVGSSFKLPQKFKDMKLPFNFAKP